MYMAVDWHAHDIVEFVIIIQCECADAAGPIIATQLQTVNRRIAMIV